jgi:hypothetical protein
VAGKSAIGRRSRTAAFAEAFEAASDDGPSLALLARVADLKQKPPPENWDGSWRMDYK